MHEVAEKYIEICDGWRLRRFDVRNWALQRFRAPDMGNGRAKSGEPSWRDTGNYFQQLGQALAFVYEKRMRDEGKPDESLRDAMERSGVIRDELMAVDCRA